MDYLYRVVYRKKREFWETPDDENWQIYISSGNPTGRPYKNAGAVRGIVSTENNYSIKVNGEYEYKAQRFPLTQEWEDM